MVVTSVYAPETSYESYAKQIVSTFSQKCDGDFTEELLEDAVSHRVVHFMCSSRKPLEAVLFAGKHKDTLTAVLQSWKAKDDKLASQNRELAIGGAKVIRMSDGLKVVPMN